MAPLAVPHHFLLVPLCNNLFLHDFMGIKGRKVCFICKAGSSGWDVRWFVWIPSLPPSLPSRFLTLSFRLLGLGWGGLWSLAEGRYGSISVALLWEVCSAIINLYERRQKDVNFAAATVAPVSVSQQWTWIILTVRGRKKDIWYHGSQYMGCKIH